jgi:acyl transferase domain-containing protein/acyl carrier protein
MTAAQDDSLTPLKKALVAIAHLKSNMTRLEQAQREPIALVGIGCRFPCGANDARAFWDVLCRGENACRVVPRDRWDADAYFSEDPDAPGKMTTRYGGFLDDVRGFDARFFGISPREAATLDPQHRLLLEVAWEALEDAGIPTTTLRGANAGVFVGIMSNDYAKLFVGHPDYAAIDAYYCTGNTLSFAPGRVSYMLGLTGPSIAIDSACSSSLVAVHEACMSLRARECNIALAGGVSLMLSPELSIYLSKARVLAPDGLCKTFDAAADGIGRGEGCGVVALKRLSDALAAGDRIYCVIRGSAVNHGGASGGLTVPNGLAQEALIRAALEDAHMAPERIDYVEAHGTGTPLGDPIEARAIVAVLVQEPRRSAPLFLGSAKTNLGHLDAAAGVAGLIKTALALKNREIPPHLHFRNPSPHIPWDDFALRVPVERTSWESRGGQSRAAGVSAFGLSGVNAHVVLEQAPEAPVHDTSPRAWLLPLSARSPEALAALADRYATQLSSSSREALHDVCLAAGARRAHHHHRLALVVGEPEEASAMLSAFARGDRPAPIVAGEIAPGERPRIGFVFSGQGSQWPRMAARLLDAAPVFRDALVRCDEALRSRFDRPILEALRADPEGSPLDATEIAQPAIFAVQVGLAEILKSWGVAPDVVIGHSVGEVAAAHVAGALSLQDAIAVVHHRSRLMQRLAGKGGMALVGLRAHDVRTRLEPFASALSVAAVNAPESTVVSGDRAALDAFVASLTSDGIATRMLRVNYAFHCTQIDPMTGELRAALASIRPTDGRVKLVSTVTGRIANGVELTGEYWARNMREPVLFADAVQTALESPPSVWVEIGPHSVLSLDIERILAERAASSSVVPTLRREQDEQRALAGCIARLYVSGVDLDFAGAAGSKGRFVELPSYPWQRQTFWFARGLSAAWVAQQGAIDPLVLAAGIERADTPGHRAWSVTLDANTLEWLRDHAVSGSAVFPASGYVQLFSAAGRQVFGDAPFRLDHVRFEHILKLDGDRAELQIALTPVEAGAFDARIFSRTSNGDGTSAAAWKCHATAVVSAATGAGPAMEDRLTSVLARCTRSIDSRAHYERMRTLGMQYGPSFQCVEIAQLGECEAVGEVRLGTRLAASAERHLTHPALLDGCFQLLALAIASTGTEGTFVPLEIASLRIYGPLGSHARCHAKVVATGRGPELLGELRVYGPQGRLLLEADGFALKKLDAPPRERFLRATWLRAALSPVQRRSGSTWLVFDAERPIAATIAAELRGRGHRCIVVRDGETYAFASDRAVISAPDDHARLIQDAFGRSDGPNGIVLVGTPGRNSNEDAPARGVLSVFETARRIIDATTRVEMRTPPRLWMITCGAQAVSPDEDVDVRWSFLWGFGLAASHEHPALRATRVDLASPCGDRDIITLIDELETDGQEDQIALRTGERFVRRVAWQSEQEARDAPAAAKCALSCARYRLDAPRPGIIQGLTFVRAPSRAPGPGEVEIEVRATALNFIDVLKAMGLYPGREPTAKLLGGECAGIVARIGDRSSGLGVGDEVVAIAFGCFASHVVADVRLVARKPTTLSFEDAVTLPIAHMTALHGLADRARLRAGERVLVHSAAGGTGLAAVQVARHLGAEVLATAGSTSKREWLRERLGIPRVFDSRSLDFVAQVMTATDGRGVDVVFNSLTGEAIPASFSVLSPFGRFVEIGKKDLYANQPIGMAHFRRNISYHVVDLVGISEQRPELCGELLAEVLHLHASNAIAPLPVARFDSSRVVDAFDHMARAKHIGKVVVSAPAAGEPVNVASEGYAVHGDGTYLISGGLGGLGLAVAEWLAHKGAGQLALLGRSAPGEAAATAIERMRAAGAKVVVERVDVADRAAMQCLFARVDAELPPLRGIVHAAGVLDDAPLVEIDARRALTVLSPKIDGAWNLHTLSQKAPLDFFVCFSSASSLLGSPGQASYASANAFLDALAHHRHARGLPALTIGWGPWSEVGMAAGLVRDGALAGRGYLPITPAAGLRSLSRLLSDHTTYAAVVPLDVTRWRDAHPAVARLPFVKDLGGELSEASSTSAVAALVTRLRDARRAERLRILDEFLRLEVAQVLRTDADHVGSKMPFDSLGLDSLMGVELKNRLELALGLALSPTLVWSYPTIAGLAGHLLARLGLERDAEAPETSRAEGGVILSAEEASSLTQALAQLAALPPASGASSEPGGDAEVAP